MRDQQTYSGDTSQLSEDLLRIGAEETASGLGFGIVVSIVFACAGFVIAAAGVDKMLQPQAGDDPQTTLLTVGLGVFLFGIGGIAAFRQIRVRDKITAALNKQD